MGAVTDALRAGTVTWRRRGDRWEAGGRIDPLGVVSPTAGRLGDLDVSLVVEGQWIELKDPRGTLRIRVRGSTSTRMVLTTGAGRYRVVRHLGPAPVWSVTPEVAGASILEVLTVGPVMRVRTGPGAESLDHDALDALHLGAVVGILHARHRLAAPAAA